MLAATVTKRRAPGLSTGFLTRWPRDATGGGKIWEWGGSQAPPAPAHERRVGVTLLCLSVLRPSRVILANCSLSSFLPHAPPPSLSPSLPLSPPFLSPPPFPLPNTMERLPKLHGVQARRRPSVSRAGDWGCHSIRPHQHRGKHTSALRAASRWSGSEQNICALCC